MRTITTGYKLSSDFTHFSLQNKRFYDVIPHDYHMRNSSVKNLKSIFKLGGFLI